MWSRLFAAGVERLSAGGSPRDEGTTGWMSVLEETLTMAGTLDPKNPEPREKSSDADLDDAGSSNHEGATGLATAVADLMKATLHDTSLHDWIAGSPVTQGIAAGLQSIAASDKNDMSSPAGQTSTTPAIEIPSYWKTTDQKSLVPQLIPITPSQKSYKEIKEKLRASGVTNTIRSITRIENIALYHEYAVRQARIQKDCPGTEVERILFHGTKSDVIQDININGFSRSYFGSANAAAFGNGVYFAVNPAYSAQQQYSPPDGNKIKYIYQCRVLTGAFCKGQRGLKAPPQIPFLPNGVRYDSVVNNEDNPTIFVIFRDSQVYPEYLIQLVDKT